jgi:hypothetical protein
MNDNKAEATHADQAAARRTAAKNRPMNQLPMLD